MLELRSVSYRYPGYRRRVLDGIDLRVRDGEIVGLVGPTESGKSTLCLVAAGLAPSSIGGELAGDVLVDGTTVRGLPPGAVAGRVGIVLQDPGSQRSGITGTVFEEVALGPVNLGLPVAETLARTSGALGALGIADLAWRSPARLSGGEEQLLAIASILAMRPRHLVLDEPTAELDPAGRRRVVDALRSLAGEGVSMIIVEQRFDVLAAVCHRVVAIDAGRIVLDGPAVAVLDDPVLERIGVRRPAGSP